VKGTEKGGIPMDYIVFYSWQMDTKDDKPFIRAALEQAVEKLRSEEGIKDFPIIDTDFKNMGGIPDLATTMFQKIKKSALFIGDLTLVGGYWSHSANGIKKTANPNVLIEMGYAAGTLSWDRIICVMNKAKPYGSGADLPVDIRSRRWPIQYDLIPLDYTQEPTEEDKRARSEGQKTLADDLCRAIKAVIDRDFEAVNEAFRKLDANCLAVLRHYANSDNFLAPDTRAFGIGSPSGVDSVVLNAAIPRLLDLSLIECGIHEGKYAYFWTYLGKSLLEKHGFRNPPLLRQQQVPRPFMCPICSGVFTLWQEGERQKTCNHCGHKVSLP
jgi:hypothetical protein